MDAINTLFTWVVVATLLIVVVAFLVIGLAAAWATRNRKGLIREASLNETQVKDQAQAFFERLSEKVRFQDSDVDIRDMFDHDLSDADKSRIVQYLIDSNLVVDATTRSTLNSIHDWTFCSPAKFLQTTDIGWSDIIAKRAAAHQPRPYHFKEKHVTRYKNSPHIETTGEKSQVEIGDVSGKKTVHQDSGLKDVVAALVEALRKDAQTLDPVKKVEAEELAASISDPSDSNGKRSIRDVVAKVTEWVKAIGGGMHATNEVLHELGELTN